MDFLYQQYSPGLSCSAINTAKSALSTFILLPGGITFETRPSVTIFVKGVFTTRPVFPRYKGIWDFSVVLEYLKIFYPLETLRLKDITFTTVSRFIIRPTKSSCSCTDS